MMSVDNPSRFCPDIDFLDSYISSGSQEWPAVKRGLATWHGLEPFQRYRFTGNDRPAVSHSYHEHPEEEEIKRSLNEQCLLNGAYPGMMVSSSGQVVGITEVKISHNRGPWESAMSTVPKKYSLRMLPASLSPSIMYGSRMDTLLRDTAMGTGFEKIEEFTRSFGVADDILSPFAEHYQGEVQVPPLSENGLRWRREVLGLMFTLAENNILTEVLQQCVDVGHSFSEVYEELCNNYFRGDDLPIDPLARIYHMVDHIPSLCHDVPIFQEERVPLCGLSDAGHTRHFAHRRLARSKLGHDQPHVPPDSNGQGSHSPHWVSYRGDVQYCPRAFCGWVWHAEAHQNH